MDWFVCFVFLSTHRNNILAFALYDCYGIWSVFFTEWAAWNLEFLKERCCFWHCWKFWWHTAEIQCHLNCWMRDWQHSAVVRSRKISGLWKGAVPCSLALSAGCNLYGSQEPLVFGVPRLRDVLSVWGTPLDFSIRLAESLRCLQCYIFQGWWWVVSSWTHQ